MRAVKAGLAYPLLGRGEEVLKESGPRSTRDVRTSHVALSSTLRQRSHSSL